MLFADEFVSMIRQSGDGLPAHVAQLVLPPLRILRSWVRNQLGKWVAIIILLGSAIPLVRAQENNLLLADAANFLDAGLTALGLITALVTTVLRRRLDAETNARDWLVLRSGESYRGAKSLTIYDEHYLNQALVLVEESSKAWAQQMLAYYSAATGKRVDLMPVAWLTTYADRAPAPKCSCGVSCRCLRFERVEGVCKHLITIAPGSVFRVDDNYDAIVCASCFHHLCHGSQDRFYQDAGAGTRGPALGRKSSNLSPSRDALLRSAAHVFAAPGRTGLMLLEAANVVNDDCVTWASTISEASTVWDSEERGNENPFSEYYRKALVGERSPGINETDFDPSLWWLSRACAFLLACVLVVLFRTDAFSSALITRRAMRGYIVDSTQTKLPMSTFCSSAKCEVAPPHFIVVTLTSAHPLPKQRLLVGCALEALLVLLWIAALAITPWFHLVGSSYLSDTPTWAAALSCAVAIVASSINVYYYFWRIGTNFELKREWAVLSLACGSIDAALLALAGLLWARVVEGHWVATSMRALMMVAAVVQWALGVQYLPTATNSYWRGSGWASVVPYALTFLRLLALVAGGGKWA